MQNFSFKYSIEDRFSAFWQKEDFIRYGKYVPEMVFISYYYVTTYLQNYTLQTFQK